MLSFPSLLAVVLAVITYTSHTQAKAVFAHFIVSFNQPYYPASALNLTNRFVGRERSYQLHLGLD